MGHIIIYFSIVIYTAYVAVMHNNPTVVLVLLTELFAPVPLFLLCIIYTARLKASIHIPVPAAEKNEEVPVEIKLSNPFWFPVNRFKLTIICENTLSKRKEKHVIKGSIPGRGIASIPLHITCESSGIISLTLKKIRVYDCIGIFFLTRFFKIKEDFTILPALFETCVMVSPLTRTFPAESDEYDTKKGGDDPSEVFQVREYQAGDRPQTIHWKLSARNDTLMVKEYSRPIGCAIVFYLDYCILTEQYLEILFSISFEMLNQQCRHYMIWYDLSTEDIQRMAMENTEDLYQLMVFLLKTQKSLPKKNLPELYKEKYRLETYACTLRLDQSLTLYKNERKEITLDMYSLEASLANMTLNV